MKLPSHLHISWTAKEIIVALAPFLILLAMVGRYSVNVPVADQYEMIPLFQKIDAQTLHLSDLWKQHNEHRIFFPKVVLLALASLTDWSINAEMTVSMIFAFIAFIAIFYAIRRSHLTPSARVLAILLASLWFFSPVQWQNWLWGWQLEWFMSAAATLWALVLLAVQEPTSKPTWRLFAAATAAIIGTYSLGSGSLVWLAGFVILGLKRSKLPQYLFWLFCSALTVGLYYWNYTKLSRGTVPKELLETIKMFTKNFLAFLGRPVSDNIPAAVSTGFIICIVTAVVLYFLYKKKQLAENSLWISLIVFVYLSGLGTTYTRMNFGIVNALSSRYTAFTLLLMISLTFLYVRIFSQVTQLFGRKLRESYLLGIITLLVLPLIGASYLSGLQGMRKSSIEMTYLKDCTQRYVPTDACLSLAYFPSREVALERLNYLKAKHWGGY